LKLLLIYLPSFFSIFDFPQTGISLKNRYAEKRFSNISFPFCCVFIFERMNNKMGDYFGSKEKEKEEVISVHGSATWLSLILFLFHL